MKTYKCGNCGGVSRILKGIGISDVANGIIKEFVTTKCDNCGHISVVIEKLKYITTHIIV
jgi:uncharacterized Zn finger protein